MIQNVRFSDFVFEFIGLVNEETKDKTLWEFWLHKVIDMSYADFLAQNEGRGPEESTNEQLEAAVRNSVDVLNSFNPDE